VPRQSVSKRPKLHNLARGVAALSSRSPSPAPRRQGAGIWDGSKRYRMGIEEPNLADPPSRVRERSRMPPARGPQSRTTRYRHRQRSAHAHPQQLIETVEARIGEDAGTGGAALQGQDAGDPIIGVDGADDEWMESAIAFSELALPVEKLQIFIGIFHMPAAGAST